MTTRATRATPEPIKSLSPRYSAIDARLARADAEVSRASLSIAAARSAFLALDTEASASTAAPEAAEASAPSPEWQSMLENLLTACAASSAAVAALTDALAKDQLR